MASEQIRRPVPGGGRIQVALQFAPGGNRVAISGDPGCDLDYYLYDEQGELRCEDADLTSRTMMQWQPAWGATGVLHVINKTPRPATVTIDLQHPA